MDETMGNKKTKSEAVFYYSEVQLQEVGRIVLVISRLRKKLAQVTENRGKNCKSNPTL